MKPIANVKGPIQTAKPAAKTPRTISEFADSLFAAGERAIVMSPGKFAVRAADWIVEQVSLGAVTIDDVRIERDEVSTMLNQKTLPKEHPVRELLRTPPTGEVSSKGEITYFPAGTKTFPDGKTNKTPLISVTVICDGKTHTECRSPLNFRKLVNLIRATPELESVLTELLQPTANGRELPEVARNGKFVVAGK